MDLLHPHLTPRARSLGAPGAHWGGVDIAYPDANGDELDAENAHEEVRSRSFSF